MIDKSTEGHTGQQRQVTSVKRKQAARQRAPLTVDSLPVNSLPSPQPCSGFFSFSAGVGFSAVGCGAGTSGADTSATGLSSAHTTSA